MCFVGQNSNLKAYRSAVKKKSIMFKLLTLRCHFKRVNISMRLVPGAYMVDIWHTSTKWHPDTPWHTDTTWHHVTHWHTLTRCDTLTHPDTHWHDVTHWHTLTPTSCCKATAGTLGCASMCLGLRRRRTTQSQDDISPPARKAQAWFYTENKLTFN